MHAVVWAARLCILRTISDIRPWMEISRISKFGWNRRGWLVLAGLVLAASLFFVWPIPRTISLRDLLLVACTGLFAWLVYQDRRAPFPWRSLRVPFGLYLALSVWIVFVALAVSDETAWAFGEIKGQWLKATMALVAGGLFGAIMLRNDGMRRVALIVMGVTLLLHVLYVDYEALRYPSLRAFMRVAGLTEGPDKSNYLTNMLLYLLLADICLRFVFQRRFLPIGNIPLVGIVALALLAVLFESLRNGVIELAIVLGLAWWVMAAVSNHARRALILSVGFALIIIVLVLGYLSLRQDDRWRTFLETVPIALDTDNKAWINEGQSQPKLASGQTVDWSNYMRIARIKAGVALTLENPLGVGFGRNAFGHAVQKKYGEGSSHSHSGLIDMSIGTGIPGTVLWLGFLASLAILGWRTFRHTRDYYALALLFLVTGYSFRMLVDSIVRDHMLQMFLFLAAFLAVVVAGQLQDRQGAASTPPG